MGSKRDSTPRMLCGACLDKHGLIRGKLGPMPDAALRAMMAYGLSEQEIGRYFGVTPSSVRRLKRCLRVMPAFSD